MDRGGRNRLADVEEVESDCLVTGLVYEPPDITQINIHLISGRRREALPNGISAITSENPLKRAPGSRCETNVSGIMADQSIQVRGGRRNHALLGVAVAWLVVLRLSGSAEED
jgi:hypothetical protein